MGNALLIEPLALSQVLSSTSASGYRASNVARDEPGIVWRSTTGSDNQILTFDLGSDKTVDAIALFGLVGAKAGWSWAIALATEAQGKFTGSYWSDTPQAVLAGSAIPVNGAGRALWQAPDGAPATARYVRLSFLDLDLTDAVQVGRACIGQGIQLARNFRFGAAFGVRPLGSVDFTRRGVLLRQRGMKLRGVGISFGHVYRDEVEETIQPLIERSGNDNAIAIVIDPVEDPQRQNRMYFGFLTGDLGTVWARPGGFQADFNMVAIY
jgi:hypothetical protein